MEVHKGIVRKFRVTWDYLPTTTNTFGNTEADDIYVSAKPYGSPDSERFIVEKSLIFEDLRLDVP